MATPMDTRLDDWDDPFCGNTWVDEVTQPDLDVTSMEREAPDSLSELAWR